MQTLQTLVSHTAWANRQLFGALRDIESFESQNGADLILRVLDHIQVVSTIFQAHLRGVPHGLEATQSALLPSFAELDERSETLDRWYVETAGSLGAEELERPRDVKFTGGNVVRMSPAMMILHVLTHTTHHRGNVDVIMIQNGMPRRRDGLPEFLVSRASST